MNKIISIAGASGVGKTTIANLLHMSMKENQSIIVSGDDMHLWERGHKNWQTYTHLNPISNNLEKGIFDLKQLVNGNIIYRNMYSHETGKFIRDAMLFPKEYIIHEGLHSLYSEFSDISHIKIYVSTSNDLKVKWKINRDTNKRGYTPEQVRMAIEKRRPDEERYITPQKNNADINITFVEINDNIEMKIQIIKNNDSTSNLALRLRTLYDRFQELIKVSTIISHDKSLSINSGGNISFKQGDKMIVSASGKDFSDISLFTGYIPVYTRSLKKAIVSSERPSMESRIHKLYEGTEQSCVLHLHPVYLNIFLCTTDGMEIIEEIMAEAGIIDYAIEDYATPGSKLFAQIAFKPPSPTLLLRNHGIFISRDSLSSCLEDCKKINEICLKKMNKLNSSFVIYEEYDTCSQEKDLFPDSVVYKEKNRVLNYFIYENIKNSNLTPRFLTVQEVKDIDNLEEEKYRKRISK
tara:strand:+ start:5144 stop:6538 length:1395 start_codon:yes stop_codon:yes gene_type:complete